MIKSTRLPSKVEKLEFLMQLYESGILCKCPQFQSIEEEDKVNLKKAHGPECDLNQIISNLLKSI